MLNDLNYLEQAEAHADEGPLGEPAARSLLKIALRLARSVAWFPIEQAPRDGTHILVCVAGKQSLPPTTVHWFEENGIGGWHLSVNQMGEYSDYTWGPPSHFQYPPPFPGEFPTLTFPPLLREPEIEGIRQRDIDVGNDRKLEPEELCALANAAFKDRATLLAAYDRLTASLAEGRDETAWLIERADVKPQILLYFCWDVYTDQGVEIRHWSWNWDVNMAARFSRKIDAELAFQAMTTRTLDDVDIHEHMWPAIRILKDKAPTT